jgi:hypothetical protein
VQGRIGTPNRAGIGRRERCKWAKVRNLNGFKRSDTRIKDKDGADSCIRRTEQGRRDQKRVSGEIAVCLLDMKYFPRKCCMDQLALQVKRRKVNMMQAIITQTHKPGSESPIFIVDFPYNREYSLQSRYKLSNQSCGCLFGLFSGESTNYKLAPERIENCPSSTIDSLLERISFKIFKSYLFIFPGI